MTSKRVLITGASRGLGAFLAHHFAANGSQLHLVARNETDLQKVAEEINRKKSIQIKVYPCDLTKQQKRSELVQRLTTTLNEIDVLINNAASQGPIGPLEITHPKEWESTISLNLMAAVDLSRGLLPLLKKSSAGSIINLSGGGATSPRPNFSAYAVSKAALVRFSETLAEETRSLGIRVNCIAPGVMPTDMLKEVLQSGKTQAGQKEYDQAEKAFSTNANFMERVAKLALFLASDASIGITGKLISAVWDRWEEWPKHLTELDSSDAYTLRRITGKDRGLNWGDR